MVLAYDDAMLEGDKWLVLFADGHVAMMLTEHVEYFLGRQGYALNTP